jgi:DNA repair exonuclease SbcCD ATPase subunit
MKATLRLKNIGGLNEGDYTFKSDKLNIVESANSSGKTSIVKALAGVLSIPKNGTLSESMFDEAMKLGIKTDPHNPFEGFVNVHANQGQAELELDGVKEKYVVKQNGDVIAAPEHGDERFLLAGVLCNNSRVLRQLRGIDQREPDDFRWAVEELSFARKYTDVAEVLKTWKEDFIEKEELIKKNIQEIKPFTERHSALQKEIEKLDSRVNKLTTELADTRVEIEGLVKDREESLKEINRLKKEMQDREVLKTRITVTELAPKQRELEKAKAVKKENESRLQKTREEIEALENKGSRKQEIEVEVNKLMDQRNTLDGILNLYIVAETSIREKKGDKVSCPLCEVGYVTYRGITQHITECRSQRESLNSKILQLNQEKQNITIQLTKAQERAQELRSKIREQSDRIGFIEKDLKKPEDAVKQIDSVIADYRRKLESEQKSFDRFDKEISSHTGKTANEEFNELNKTRSRLHEESGRILGRLSELSVFPIMETVYDTKVAALMVKDVIEVLKDRITHLEQRAEEEREQAARRFNESINILLANLGFKEFRTVKLAGSPSYRLYVERFDSQKKDYKSQDVGTLSTSEKLAISMILQMALKETYMRNTPFLIVDDVLEDFDPERRDRVIEYLKDKISKENWFIVATKLVEERGPPTVKYL